jgi:hypothetical protein
MKTLTVEVESLPGGRCRATVLGYPGAVAVHPEEDTAVRHALSAALTLRGAGR